MHGSFFFEDSFFFLQWIHQKYSCWATLGFEWCSAFPSFLVESARKRGCSVDTTSGSRVLRGKDRTLSLQFEPQILVTETHDLILERTRTRCVQINLVFVRPPNSTKRHFRCFFCSFLVAVGVPQFEPWISAGDIAQDGQAVRQSATTLDRWPQHGLHEPSTGRCHPDLKNMPQGLPYVFGYSRGVENDCRILPKWWDTLNRLGFKLWETIPFFGVTMAICLRWLWLWLDHSNSTLGNHLGHTKPVLLWYFSSMKKPWQFEI